MLDDFTNATETQGYNRIEYSAWRKIKTSSAKNFVVIHSFPKGSIEIEELEIREYYPSKKEFGKTVFSFSATKYDITQNNSLTAFLINHWKDYPRFYLEDKTIEITQGGYFIDNLDLTNNTIDYKYSPNIMSYKTTTTTDVPKAWRNYATTAAPNSWNDSAITTSIDDYIQQWYSSNDTTIYHHILNQLDTDGYIVKQQLDTKNNNNNDKEKKSMKTNDMFNFEFGPVSDRQFRLSPYGIAVSTVDNGWVSYNAKTGEIFNVDIINFDVSKLIYKMPVAFNAIAVGDILIHGRKPVFVRAINTDGTVSVINYADASVVNIMPVKSPFGFNFFTKVCPLVDFGTNNATSDNPFGTMLPFLMMNDNENFDPMMLFFLNGNGNGNNMFQNPMMMYFLMNKGENKDFLPYYFLMNGFAPAGNAPGTPATPAEAPTA